ncbi:MotB family protein [Leptospira interrogans]
MNSQASDEKPHELILVRRRGGDHDHSHGGSVWKIAYADFMTAMMAFFLVMWLINASDKETLTAVASYFDPIRLTDKIANPRGLHDMDSGARGNEDRPGESSLKDGTSKGDPRAEVGPKAKYPEDVLFSDPYGILAKLAALATVEKAVEAQGQADAVNVAGEAFRDPFDPEFKSPNDQAIAEIMRSQAEAQQLERAVEAAQLAKAAEAQGERSTVAGAGVAPDANVGASASDAVARDSSSESSDQDRLGKAESPPAPVVDPGLEAQIKHALRESAPGAMPHVEVRGTSEGILISLTDEFDFGMFAISSAEPRPETVVLMERIAKILVDRPEQIVVRGHTDGRPFKSQTYDNWRLSSARAHMAYYMLVRGGIEEKRFERIEGHADRNLKVAGEPEAAQNRRIEILLRRGHAS